MDKNYRLLDENLSQKENIQNFDINFINNINDDLNATKNVSDFDENIKPNEKQNICFSHPLNENKLITNKLNAEPNPLLIKNKMKNQMNGKDIPFS